MGNYDEIKAAVANVIKANGNKEITGEVMQNVLLSVINSLGAGAIFAGIATPATNPGTPDGPVFYIASESGTYPNFNAIELQDELSVLMWNGSWSSQQILSIDDVPTAGSDNLVKGGGIFNEINGDVKSDTRTWTNVQNQIISYDFSAGDMLIIQLLADSDFFVEITFNTSSGWEKVGEVSKQNDIVAIKVPNDIVESKIFYTHTGQGTVTGTINLCIVDDVTKVPYRFYKLFEDTSNISNIIQKTQFKPNLFVLDEAADKKFMDEIGVVKEFYTFLMSNYLPVQPNKTYKCSAGIHFINFFDYGKTRTRGYAQDDTPTTFKTGGNEYFVVVSLADLTFLQKEMVIIQEVTDESDELDASNVGMGVDEKISDGSYSLAKINGYYSGQFKLGNALHNSNFISLSINDGDKLIATSIVGSYAGKITHLHFYCSCETNFNLTLGIGNIDQRNWGLISRTFVVEVVNGENNIDISQTIEEDERLFVIANSASTSANAKLYTGDTGIHSESNDGDITMSPVSGYVAIEYSISGNRILSDSQLATLTQLSEVSATLNDKIQDINLGNLFIQSPNNNYFRLTISNEGVLTPVAVPVQGDILIMGNSYDVHGIMSGVWWGDFGMAASRKENDWKHQLLTKLRKNDNLIYSFTKQLLADWETTWNKTDDTVEDIFNYNDTTLPALAGTPNYSMVIIRIGENNSDTNYERVQLRMKNLLQYIRTKVGNDVPIVLGGCVKIRTEQNPSFIAAANEVPDVTYVDMTPAGLIVPFAAGLDYKVLGDDGVWHTISESTQASAVAEHPNDMVFAKMAELLYPVVVEKLGI